MKKYSILAVVLVLTLSVFTGCGCRRQEPNRKPTENMTIAPTTLPATEAPTTIPATEMPTTPATENHTTDSTADGILTPDGTDNGNTETATESTREGRASRTK